MKMISQLNAASKILLREVNVKISDLREAKYNPRLITDKKLELLNQSIQEFGDLSGVVFNRRTKTLISGHQRTKTLKDKKTKIVTRSHVDDHGTVELGHIEVRTNSGIVTIPFRVVDWDKRKEKAANIAANAHGGKFDNDKLAVLVAELETAEFDIESIGIDSLLHKQINLMNKTAPKEFEQIDETKFKFEHTCPKCKYQF